MSSSSKDRLLAAWSLYSTSILFSFLFREDPKQIREIFKAFKKSVLRKANKEIKESAKAFEDLGPIGELLGSTFDEESTRLDIINNLKEIEEYLEIFISIYESGEDNGE